MAMVGFRHIGLKILSIALAALLWLVVSGEQIVERELRIPLEFTNLPPQLEMVGFRLNVADVRVRGSSGALSRIAAGDIVAVLDLRAAREGPRLFPLAMTDVRAPFGVEVVQVTPSTVSMSFELSARKFVPVIPEVDGEPAPGFEIGPSRAEPATVEVVGPTTALAGLTSAITETVSVAGATGPVTETVNVGVTDPAVRLAAAERVSVTVQVAPAQQQWAVANVPVTVLNGQGRVTLIPETVTLHLRGPREAMGSDAAAFDASVDVAGLRPGRYALPVRVVLPPRIGITRVDPAEVTVSIQ
jgi:YbbR domain-containing protein